MPKLTEFLAMPTHCSRPSGASGMRDRGRGPHDRESFDCEHERLQIEKDLVKCWSCGRQWKDCGTGGKK